MRFLLIAGLLVTILAGCRPANRQVIGKGSESGLTVQLEVAGRPQVGETTVLVHLLEGDEGVSGADIEVTGDMTHAGMTPVVSRALEVEPGLYRTTDFTFTMAGDWFLSAEGTLPEGEKISATLPIQVAR